MTLLDWIALGVVAFGVILLIVEVYAPGFGLPGLAGLLLCAGGIAMFADTWAEAMIMATIVVAIVAVAFGFTLYSAAKGRLSRSRLILNDAVTDRAGYADFDDLASWVGKTGVTLSPLRPAGVAKVEDKRLDVVTQGEFLSEGESVRITQVQGRQIVVCRA